MAGCRGLGGVSVLSDSTGRGCAACLHACACVPGTTFGLGWAGRVLCCRGCFPASAFAIVSLGAHRIPRGRLGAIAGASWFEFHRTLEDRNSENETLIVAFIGILDTLRF